MGESASVTGSDAAPSLIFVFQATFARAGGVFRPGTACGFGQGSSVLAYTSASRNGDGVPAPKTRQIVIPKQMLRILYFSQATQGFSSEQIREILETSQRNNAAAGITGVLLHGGGLFMQVLEGPEGAVLRAYVKILDDRRHSNSQLIHISPVSERMFASWSMAVLDSTPVEFRDIAELRSLRLESVSSKAFANVMHAFVKRLNGPR